MATTINGTNGNDYLAGTAAADTLNGRKGRDTLDGGDGDDTLNGGAGKDWLYGGAGSDTMVGGLGNDTYIVTDGDGDVLSDAGGVDTIILNGPGTGGGIPSGFENLTVRGPGSPFIEGSIGGNEADNIIRNQTGTAIMFIDGKGGNDTLIGGYNQDWFTFSGPSGAHGDDVVDGRAGVDTLSLSSTTAITIDFRAGTVTGDPGGIITFSNIEQAHAGGFNDLLIASDAGVALGGDNGNDTLVGGNGNDALWGEGGFQDHATFDAGDDVISGGGGNDAIRGGLGNDSLSGGTGDDVFYLFSGYEQNTSASYGTDSIHGGKGVDQVTLFAKSAVVVDLSAGTVVGGSAAGAGTASLVSIENFRTDGFDARLTGSAGNNMLLAGIGNDTISGAGGNDYIFAGGGNDTVNGGSGADTIDSGAGADIIQGGAGNDTLFWGAEDIRVSGNGGTDRLRLRVESDDLDLTAVANGKIRDVEIIDMTAHFRTSNTLTLNQADLLDISSTNTLKVFGDDGDSVNIVGSFVDQGVSGGFHRYKVGAGTLLVDTDITNVS